ncbi:nudix hydrolase 9 isoform X1 [Salvia miltiorrhiza]|uniref:nudix hydrolase 9 isoform X1 n=1 Tax=Salvia miltiorrhiza TaxID=226208 RepID=UPI0025AD03FB|nr:nudix hydrolase 9 isoform X1 [Salvia miltiorrhiza]
MRITNILRRFPINMGSRHHAVISSNSWALLVVSRQWKRRNGALKSSPATNFPHLNFFSRVRQVYLLPRYRRCLIRNTIGFPILTPAWKTQLQRSGRGEFNKTHPCSMDSSSGNNIRLIISQYGGHILDGEPHSSQKTNVRLHLGLTDYRTFVGTNLNPLWERFLVSSEDDWRRCQHTSNPLGNGAIVETSNKEVVVLQRSANVGEFPEHFVFPGGHPEPKEVGIIRHQTTGELTHQKADKRVSQEMFDSIIREVVEEIGVPASTLGEPIFIGISQRALNVRPAAFFFIKCSLQSEEIQQRYSSAEDSYESTQLYTMPMSDLAHIMPKMPGCHQGGFALYKLMVDAAKEKKQCLQTQ